MIIPIPLPQHQHIFVRDDVLTQDCRNVISDKNCAGAEGEELVLKINMKNATTFVRTRSGDHFGDAKC